MPSFHMFSSAAAQRVGVNAAVLLHHIATWCEHNAHNKANYRDGRYWTYNSYAAFEKMFPYLSYKQIRTALGTLEKEGLVVTATYNDRAYDKTKWYSVTSDGLALDGYVDERWADQQDEEPTLCPPGQTPSAPQGRPIPDNIYIPDNNIPIGIGLPSRADALPHRAEAPEPETEPTKRKRRKPFVKPTPAEVDAYIREKGYSGFDGEQFCDHYESNGWMVGRTPMVDWKRACATWNRNNGRFGRSAASVPQPIPASAYNTRHGR